MPSPALQIGFYFKFNRIRPPALSFAQLIINCEVLKFRSSIAAFARVTFEGKRFHVTGGSRATDGGTVTERQRSHQSDF